MHAVTSYLVKSFDNKLVSTCTMKLLESIAVIPLLFILPVPHTSELCLLIAGSVCIHVLYRIFMVESFRLGDFSVVYPLARGTAPLLTAVGALVFLGEDVSIPTFISISLLCFGISLFSLDAKKCKISGLRNVPLASIVFAFLTGLCTVAYTLVDAQGVRLAEHPLTYVAWSYLLQGPILFTYAYLKTGKETFSIAKKQMRRTCLTALLAGSGYPLALLSMKLADVSKMAALRETSVLFGVLIGVFILNERTGGSRRIVAACIIAAGAVCVKVF